MNWSEILSQIRQSFPEVQQLSTLALARWLEGPAPLPLLLDVREEDEYQVSHLPDARHFAPHADLSQELAGVARAQPIVAYCSIGYRSSLLAARLSALGYRQVYNLEGSIFAWANEGRPVFREGRRVYEVHPYDDSFGALLARELHPANSL